MGLEYFCSIGVVIQPCKRVAVGRVLALIVFSSKDGCFQAKSVTKDGPPLMGCFQTIIVHVLLILCLYAIIILILLLYFRPWWTKTGFF
ncbi:hypothetical protein Hdeb2414_s0007g00259831 [Helianthus debilis subsp. tardiflorus]